MLLGQCLELAGAQIPYAPLVAALRPLARGMGADAAAELPEGARNALAELLPELGGVGTRADEEPSARQGRLFEAMLALLERLGRSGPVLLALEDIHWADGATRDFITFLVRSAREEPLCLVVTYRSDELHRRHPLRPLLAELERAAGVERIALERFDHDELAAQLEGILHEPAPAELAERLYGRSQGNPLFTEELLANAEDGDSWLLPETLRDALLARVERLSAATQAVVRATAVLDRPITHGLLEAIAGVSSAEVMEGAREAVAHQVLVTSADGTYGFRHALVGEAVHGDLLPGEDTALHARIAAALKERPELLGDVPEATVAAELACHLQAAHDLSGALGANVRAGLAAKRVYAYQEAGRQFERALELWARVPDAEERAGMDRTEVLRHAATCAIARGEASRGVALIREALASLDEQAEPVRAAALYLRLGAYLRQGGAGRDSLPAFDRAIALLPPDAVAERARALESRARVEMLMGDYEQTLATVTQAIAGARAAGAELTEVRALNTLGFTRALLGEEEEGIATLRESYDRGGALASPADQGRAAVNLSELLDLTGRTAEGLEVARAELVRARKRPERTAFDAFLSVQEAYLLSRLGRLAEAHAAMPARIPGEAISYAGIFWSYMRARLALVTGDLDTARVALRELQRQGENVSEPQWIEPRAEIEVELAVRADRLEDARAVLSHAAPLILHSDEAPRLLRMSWMAQRVEADAAGRARALGERLRARAGRHRRRAARARRGHAQPRGARVARAGGRRAHAAPRAARRGAHGRRRLGRGRARVRRARAAAVRRRGALPRRRGAGRRGRPRGRRGAAARRGGDGARDRRGADRRRRRRARPARADRPGGAGGGGPGGRARRLARRSARADAARARGAAARRRGADEPGDRRGALHEREDRVSPRLADPRQARRERPRRGGRGRAPARARRRRADVIAA